MIQVNGKETDLIPVVDRGFQYGDGCFTTLEVRGGTPLFLQRHRARLLRDCRRLSISAESIDAAMAEAQAMAASGRDGVVKIIMTRGQGGRGYRWPETATPTRVVGFHPRPDYPADYASTGVALHLCRTRLGINPALAGVKHMNRLEQILARNEWTDSALAEGILLDALGYVAEGTMSNVFMVRGGCLETPRLDRCGVAGVMRELVMELASGLGLVVRERRCRLAWLRQADEVFLSNSLIGIWPVRSLEDSRWRPGPCTRRLAEAVERAKQRELLGVAA